MVAHLDLGGAGWWEVAVHEAQNLRTTVGSNEHCLLMPAPGPRQPPCGVVPEVIVLDAVVAPRCSSDLSGGPTEQSAANHSAV